MQKLFFATIFFFLLILKVAAQCPTKENIEEKISLLNANQLISDSKKLEDFYLLKDLLDKCKTQQDSIYSNLLLSIGYYEIRSNKNFDAGIKLTKASLKLNTNVNPGGSKYLTAKGYFSIAVYYYQLLLYNQAVKYFDSTIIAANAITDSKNYVIRSGLYKAYIYFQKGDYQEAEEESTSGIYNSLQKKDSTQLLELLTQRSQAFYYENKLAKALEDANLIIAVAKKNQALYELAAALKLKATVFQKQQQFTTADSLFKKAISTRIQTNDFEQISSDYIDYGNFYLDSLSNYNKAKYYYVQALWYAKKIQDSVLLAKINTNLAELYLKQKNYLLSSAYCLNAFVYLNAAVSDINKNPASNVLIQIGTKEIVMVLIANKIETLLNIFLYEHNNDALNGCLQTCLVMDTLITKMRQEQTGNESKLYWRYSSNDFYANAVKASFLANKPDLGFYFLEKSRAVLLNDKLNELDASSQLSKADADKQESFEINIIGLEQKLSLFSDTSKQYQHIQLKLIEARNQLYQFIVSLGQKYPAYYQYKYDDKVPSLKDLQQYLAKTNQCFVHYFFGDTATYILAITAGKTNFIRLSQKDFNKEQLSDFIKLCADKQALNNNYNAFAQLSNSIYKKIFQPLQLPKGRIIICTDNAVIPFDALCSDVNGKDFLLNNYSFSYVYSARSLMRQFKFSNPQGNFVGFAPVSFEKYLQVQDLKNAADALNESAAYYKTDKLFTHQTATRNNFFNYASSYSVVNIFSHARADTSDNEPVLFMQDSLIHLSELQLLNNPATQLVLLSACQTNVGKAATGEGIYSLARGFAAAGIPSVSATLWKADEQAIYAISEKFNQYLSGGINKDEALQKAKLDFIKANKGSEKLLPYYWANMILIGNADELKLSNSSSNNYVWIIAAIMLFIAIIFIIRKNHLNKSNKTHK